MMAPAVGGILYPETACPPLGRRFSGMGVLYSGVRVFSIRVCGCSLSGCAGVWVSGCAGVLYPGVRVFSIRVCGCVGIRMWYPCGIRVVSVWVSVCGYPCVGIRVRVCGCGADGWCSWSGEPLRYCYLLMLSPSVSQQLKFGCRRLPHRKAWTLPRIFVPGRFGIRSLFTPLL
jgi:hypothetical protein